MKRIVNPSILGIDFDNDFVKESFTMREYLIDRFVEKAIDKAMSKSIERRLGGNGERYL